MELIGGCFKFIVVIYIDKDYIYNYILINVIDSNLDKKLIWNYVLE